MKFLQTKELADLKCMQKVEALRDPAGPWLDGTIVCVLHDNSDGGVIPFTQITVKFAEQYPRRTYSGPQILAWVRV